MNGRHVFADLSKKRNMPLIKGRQAKQKKLEHAMGKID